MWKEMLFHQFKDRFLAVEEYTDLERRDTFRHVLKLPLLHKCSPTNLTPTTFFLNSKLVFAYA
jgi:hypothetical protein